MVLRICCLLLSAGLLSAAGCGEPRPVRQHGVVTLEGQALAGATVTFLPADNKRPASAVTDEKGRFELMTFAPGDGALPGEYKVVVIAGSSAVWGSTEAAAEKKTAVHPNYSNPKTTPLHGVVPTAAGITLALNNNGM